MRGIRNEKQAKQKTGVKDYKLQMILNANQKAWDLVTTFTYLKGIKTAVSLILCRMDEETCIMQRKEI